jgi:hypothetical protein
MKAVANMDFEIDTYIPGIRIKDLADRFLSDRTGADDAIHGREMATIRPDHRRPRGIGVKSALRDAVPLIARSASDEAIDA